MPDRSYQEWSDRKTTKVNVLYLYSAFLVIVNLSKRFYTIDIAVTHSHTHHRLVAVTSLQAAPCW